MELSASKAAEIRAVNRPVLILSRPNELRVIPVTSELMAIGSDPTCSLHLPDDRLDSRHAVIQPTQDGFEIFNLSAKHDTLRNGQQVDAAELVQGDEIRLGSAMFTYIDPNADIMPAGFQLLALPIDFLRSQAIIEAQTARNAQTEGFNDVLVDSLKRSPWILMSGAIHALIYIMLIGLMPAPLDEDPLAKIEVDMAEADDIDEDAQLDEFDVDEAEPELEELEDPPEMMEDQKDDVLFDSDDLESDDPAESSEPVQGMGSFRPGNDAGKGIGGNGNGIGIPSGAGEVVRQKVKRLQESGLDVVVLLDATGSMDGEIDAAKQEIVTLIASLQAMKIEFRLGVVAFRDRGEEYITKRSPLTGDVYKSVAFLDQMSAVGGGDEPEAVLDAFKDAARMRYSHKAEKVLILVGDAPPKPQTTKKVLTAVESFAARGGHVHTIYTDSDLGDRDWSGTKKIFKEIARVGNGSAVQLKSDKGLVADILKLTLQTATTAQAETMLRQIESGPRAEQIRRRVRSLDPRFVAKVLRLKNFDPQIPLEILRHNHEKFLPAYFAVLNDKKLPRSNRWLTTVLLRRLLRQINSYNGIGGEASRLLAKFNPEAPFRKQQVILTQLKQTLYDSGLLKLDLEVKKPGKKR
ncbi:MAG: Mg-chelatase subunit ChlD [Planctomycetota bacterium]|jgi:Mg-chelatase subunit ChlD